MAHRECELTCRLSAAANTTAAAAAATSPAATATAKLRDSETPVSPRRATEGPCEEGGGAKLTQATLRNANSADPHERQDGGKRGPEADEARLWGRREAMKNSGGPP